MSSNLLTASRLKVARACRRQHRIEYVLGYRPVETAAELAFGTAIHAALEAWWDSIALGMEDMETLDAALRAIPADMDPFERVKAEWMVRGYHLRWYADAQRYIVLGVEVEFNTDLRNPSTGRISQTWRLAGKLDVLVKERSTGHVFIIEHKTSGEDIAPGSKYWRRLRMDGQVSVYFEGAGSLGFEVDGCLYDVLGKPRLKPLKAPPPEERKYTQKGFLYANQRDRDETVEEYGARIAKDMTEHPEAYFQRGDVVRLASEMDEALCDIWDLAQELREAHLANRAPRNPDACERYGRQCPFFDVCSGVASLDDETRFKRLENVHPELSAVPREEVVQ